MTVAVVVVQVLAEPSCGGVGCSPAGMLPRGGELPDVAEDVRDPSLGAVEGLRRAFARRDDALDPVGERADGLGKCALLGRPIVHLQVDIQMIVPIPRSLDGLRPQPLQVGGQCTRACAGEKEVASELHIERGQGWVQLGMLVVGT